MSSGFRPLRVKLLATLQHTVGAVHQLAHHGTDDTHLAFTPLLQALRPRLKEPTAPQRRDRWKVERSPQPRITDL